MTEHDKMPDPIRDKLLSLVPDILTRNVSCIPPAPFSGLINFRDETIRLSDVLQAIKKMKRKVPVTVSEEGDILDTETGAVAFWYLERDSYDLQSEETKQFIGTLLGERIPLLEINNDKWCKHNKNIGGLHKPCSIYELNTPLTGRE